MSKTSTRISLRLPQNLVEKIDKLVENLSTRSRKDMKPTRATVIRILIEEEIENQDSNSYWHEQYDKATLEMAGEIEILRAVLGNIKFVLTSEEHRMEKKLREFMKVELPEGTVGKLDSQRVLKSQLGVPLGRFPQFRGKSKVCPVCGCDMDPCGSTEQYPSCNGWICVDPMCAHVEPELASGKVSPEEDSSRSVPGDTTWAYGEDKSMLGSMVDIVEEALNAGKQDSVEILPDGTVDFKDDQVTDEEIKICLTDAMYDVNEEICRERCPKAEECKAEAESRSDFKDDHFDPECDKCGHLGREHDERGDPMGCGVSGCPCREFKQYLKPEHHLSEAIAEQIIEWREKNKPWLLPSDGGYLPGEICCKRAAGNFCHFHNPGNYDQKKPGNKKR